MPEINGPAMTQQFEGYRDKVYKDTVGKRTIGWGFNIDEPGVAQLLPQSVTDGLRPLAPEEAQAAYAILYRKAQQDAVNFAQGKYDQLTPIKQAILTDLAYNLGPNKLSKFVNFQSAMLQGNDAKAAAELKNSKWYKQTGQRGRHHVLTWASGE